ncbi:MAG: sigma-70 family RNA polymerase sigma factor [Cyanobacteria bacterium P01_D01_bin.115]
MQKHTTKGAFSAGLRQAKKRRSLAPFEEYRRRPTPRLRNRLVRANMGLAEKEARRWTHQCSEPFEDLLQEGLIGLTKAVDEFDPSTRNAFSSFAMPWIRGAIQHYLRDKGWGVLRVPRQAVEVYSKVKGAQRLMIAAGHDLTSEEVAAGLGLTPERWRFVREVRELPSPMSLDDSPLEIEDGVEAEQDFSWVMGYLQELPILERACIVERVLSSLSIEQIARRHQITEVVVQGLIKSGFKTMRDRIEGEGRYGNDH